MANIFSLLFIIIQTSTFKNVIKWADIYENADLPTKQIIVEHLIDSISVKKGYELTVNFKISLEQFENGLEFQALSS